MIPEYWTTLPTFAAGVWGSRAAHTPDHMKARPVPVSGPQISQNTELVGFYGHDVSRGCTILHNISWVFLWIFQPVNPELHAHPGRSPTFSSVSSGSASRFPVSHA